MLAKFFNLHTSTTVHIWLPICRHNDYVTSADRAEGGELLSMNM